jgi:hypothetical protein
MAFFGTLFMNIIVKIIIELKFNNFKYERDKKIIRKLTYLQSTNYLVLFYLVYNKF